ncbi:hypothetical protein ONO86_06140 [Micromonospora noduli]|nr:hypothetical protein ONO86_06140 [Micromonospora noduli]
MAVRPRPQPPPVRAGPVEQVVPAAGFLGAGPVGDLVPGEPGRVERGLRGQVAVRGHVVTGVRQLAAPHPGGEPGAVLDDQGVRADVVHSGGDDLFQRGAEVLGPLPRGAVDQVQVDVLEPGVARLQGGGGGPAGAVFAVQDRQHPRGGGLHAQRDPGVAGGPQQFQRFRGDRLGVGLGGHLGVGGQPPGAVDAVEDAGQVVGGEQGGRAAADEDGVDPGRRGVAEHPGGELQLGQHSVRVPLAAGAAAQFGGGVGVEVAVSAAAGAERHVHVHAEAARADRCGGGGGQRSVDGDGLTIWKDAGHGH